MQLEHIGISAIEIALPDERMTLEEMSKLSGIKSDILFTEVGVLQKPVLKNGEQPLDLAIRVSNNLCRKNEINPKTIDFVIYGGSAPLDNICYSAAKIQKEIGADNAFSFDVRNGCNSGNLCLNLAKTLLQSDPEKNTTLIILADSLSKIVDYANKDHSCLFNLSDGACAVLLRKGEERNQLLTFSGVTNARFADNTFQGLSDPFIKMSTDKEEDRELSKEYFLQYQELIRKVAAQAGLEIAQVDHLFMNQGDHKLIRRLADALPMDFEKIFRSHEQFGHLGSVDCFLGLQSRLADRKIQPGQHIILASSAVGYSWGATVLKA